MTITAQTSPKDFGQSDGAAFIGTALLRQLALTVVVACMAFTAHAQPAANTAIANELVRLFKMPSEGLRLQPMVIAHAHALVGWVHKNRGGRALLKAENGTWSVVACSGPELRESRVLRAMGVDRREADVIARRFAREEQRLAAEALARMDQFPGLITPTPPTGYVANKFGLYPTPPL